MTRFTLSLVLGLGVVAGLFAQPASAAFPITACKPGSSSSNYSAFNSPYSRGYSTAASYWDNSYSSRYNNRYDCGSNGYGSTYDNRYLRNTNDWLRNDRYSSWNDNNYRWSDYSRLNRVRDAYNDRFDDYRHNHRSYSNSSWRY